jgi:hypothetical protein
MKIYNIETKQVIESDKLQEWVDCFQLAEMGQDKKQLHIILNQDGKK